MMCDCDERVGRMCLSHQLSEGVELRTQKRVPVTLGFQPQVCRECRGLSPRACPVAAIHGRTSKIKRYYWRELELQTMERFHVWLSKPEALEKSDEYKYEMRKSIESKILEEIKEFHNKFPKYKYKEVSQADIIKRYNIEILDLKAKYLHNSSSEASRISDEDGACSVEEYVARLFRRQGFGVLHTESRPIHVLFGVYMWMLIQDPSDTRSRIVSFGDRFAYQQGEAGNEIWMALPDDFGTSGFGRRRAKALKNHIEFISAGEDLEWLFEYWLSSSEHFRQYLWAHEGGPIETARQLVKIIPADVLISILGHLARNYWGRFVGWPDLFVYREKEWFFVEVKGSGDKLSEDQKKWIAENERYLHLPFKIAKIHKKGVLKNETTDKSEV